jgi:hypothetical protein
MTPLEGVVIHAWDDWGAHDLTLYMLGAENDRVMQLIAEGQARG